MSKTKTDLEEEIEALQKKNEALREENQNLRAAFQIIQQRAAALHQDVVVYSNQAKSNHEENKQE